MEDKKPTKKLSLTTPEPDYPAPDIQFYPNDNQQVLTSSGNNSEDGMEDEL